MSNPGDEVSATDELNLQGMIYYIKTFKSIGRTCTHADVKLTKVRAMHHQRYMEESHKDPEVVPTVDPKDWTKTLETVEDFIKEFQVEDGKPLSYRFSDDFIAPDAATDITYRTNGSKYFTHDEEIIS